MATRRRRNPDRPGDTLRRQASSHAYASALKSIKGSQFFYRPHGNMRGYTIAVPGKGGYFPDFMLEFVASSGAFAGKAITYTAGRGGRDYVIQLNARTSEVSKHKTNYQPTSEWLAEALSYSDPDDADQPKIRTRLASILAAMRARHSSMRSLM
jgi:hypothetical protein